MLNFQMLGLHPSGYEKKFHSQDMYLSVPTFGHLKDGICLCLDIFLNIHLMLLWLNFLKIFHLGFHLVDKHDLQFTTADVRAAATPVGAAPGINPTKSGSPILETCSQLILFVNF